MQKSNISWTGSTWNPISGCSKVSDGCKHCYAMTLSLKRGWTTLPWTIQNEEANVVMKPHKLNEPYKLKEPQRVFTNSMSDMFHRVLPDWYIAAMFCVMLDNPQHVFQVLTKRPERTVDWHERFLHAMKTPSFFEFREQVKDQRVKAALAKDWQTPWGDNIWMGTSVEDARVTHRIATLSQSLAVTKFISAEPLLGPFGPVDFSGIDWVIVGGESGFHLTGPEDPRWMKMEWAREIRDMCVAQKVAYFYKQDSAKVTEVRPWLVEEDGSRWEWHQYPGELSTPVNLDGAPEPEPPAPTHPLDGIDRFYWTRFGTYRLERNGEIIRTLHLPDDFNDGQPETLDYDKILAEQQAQSQWKPAGMDTKNDYGTIFERFEQNPKPPAPQRPTTLVSFRDVKDHWNKETRQWDSDEFVYIGREENRTYYLPESRWANHNPIYVDTIEERMKAIAKYRTQLTGELDKGKGLLDELIAELRGKTLVCWCREAHNPKPCHGDVLLELLGEKPNEAAQQEAEQPEQMTLFDMRKPVQYD